MSVHWGGRGYGHISRNSGAARPKWVSGAAKLDADFTNNRYWALNHSYLTEAAFLAALGGSKSGVTRTVGPYVDPTGTNRITNGGFSNGVTGWTASGTGASIAEVSGEGELTSGTAVGNIQQQVDGLGAQAFQFTATARRGTSTSSFQWLLSVNSGLGGALYGPASSTSTTNVTQQTLVPRLASTMYFGLRKIGSGGAAGTHYVDNVSLVEVWPFQGFSQGAIAVAINATAPAAAVADEVLFQLDCGSEVDRVRVVRLVADDTLHVIFTAANSEVANLNLGAVADGAAFGIALSGATGAFSASLNGGAPVTDSAGTCPNLGVMRIGRSFTGNTWTGTIERVTVF